MINFVFLKLHPLYRSLYFLYKRVSDNSEISWISNYLKKGMTAIDVGSNIGFYTLLFSTLVGQKGSVYSFEPDKTNFRLLKKNVKDRKNIFLQNYAISDRNGIINLYLSQSLNVDHHTYKSEEARIVNKVKCVSIDNFFKSKPQIDLIKVDIQGFDYFAIKGAQRLIKRQKKIAIIGEFWPYGLKMAGVNPEHYIDLLKSLDLKVIINLDRSLDEMIGNKWYYTNFIAFK